MGRFTWILGTYGGTNEHNMVGPCRNEDAQLTAVLNTVIARMDTAVSIEFCKERFVEVRKSVVTMLWHFKDLSDPDQFRNVKLHVELANNAELESWSG